MRGQRWLCESVHSGVLDRWWLDEVVHESQTAIQEVLVARTGLGITLFCDRNPQSAELGQLHFHEAEVLPAMSLAQRAQRVLVIGCSEGTVSRLAVRAGAVLIDHVDLDPECVRICAEHLPYGFSLDEVERAERGIGPVRLHYGDGFDFVRHAGRDGVGYDVIVLDLPEEQENSDIDDATYLRRDFLTHCRELLAPGGVVATHVSRPSLSVPTARSRESLRRPWREFGEVFGTRVYFRSDEQPWAAIMLGRADVLPDPVDTMRRGFAALPSRAATMDERTLLRASQEPRSLRDH